MKRTQIYLDDELYETLRRVAFEQRKSVAHVAREAIQRYLAASGQKPAPRAAREQTAVYTPRAVSTRARRLKKPRVVRARQATTKTAELTSEELRELEKNPLYHIIGLGESTRPDSGINHDYYLYHEDKE
jgi:hypothetical protein